MKFTVSRESLLAPLAAVVGVIEKKQTMPVLSNVLLQAEGDIMDITGTDLEVQLVARVPVEAEGVFRLTVPARKWLDIIRLLPEHSSIQMQVREDKLLIRSGSSRYTLNTLPADSYPAFDSGHFGHRISLPANLLRKAIEKTAFAIAQIDVRYYLKGLLIDFEGVTLRTVASDGHRLAVFQDTVGAGFGENLQIIMPRKGVQELHRLVGESEDIVTMEIAHNTVRLDMGSICFSSKLIEGRYPDYQKVMPQEVSSTFLLDRDTFKGAISRVAVLTSEKQKSIGFEGKGQEIILACQNPEHDESEERLLVEGEGGSVSVGFNAAYLLEAIGHLDAEEIRLSFTPDGNSCLLEGIGDQRFKCVVMPMRL